MITTLAASVAERALRARELAGPFIAAEELFMPFAYPDPRSPMARAMGMKLAWNVGRTGVVPAAYASLDAHPWTIGFGDTGAHVRRGLRWSRQQATDALSVRLVHFQRDARRTWPGIELLDARAEAAFISLAYNRGTDLRKRKDDPLDRRREMRALIAAVARGDYVEMAQLFVDMCRIWEGHALEGLIKRRKAEAALILSCIPNSQARKDLLS